jgi:hypothetical protein
LSTEVLELTSKFVDLFLHSAHFLADAGHGTFHVYLVFEVFATSVGFLLESFGHLMNTGCMEVVDCALEVVQLLFECFRAMGLPWLLATTLTAIDFAFDFSGGIQFTVGAEFPEFAMELA